MKASEPTLKKSKWISLDQRLRLDQVSPALRSYAAQMVGVALFACLIIILYGLHLYPFEETTELPASLSPIPQVLSVPFSLMFVLLVGLGLVAGALFYASYQPGWSLPLITRLVIGALTLAFPLSFLDYSQSINETGMGPGLIPFVIVLLATGCGAATLVSAFIPSPRAARWAARLATGSFLFMALAFLLFKVWWNTLTDLNQINPETMWIIQIPIVTFISYLTPFVWLTGVVFFWEAITEVKIFSRNIGIKVASLSDRLPWLLGALFVVKIAWLAAGYWTVMRRTAAGAWKGSSEDGPWAWLLAALFAIAAGWWLTQQRTPVDTKSFTKVTVFLTGGFLLFFIVAFLLFIPATILNSLGLESLGISLGTISESLAGFGGSWTFLFASLLVPLGLVFLRSKRFRYLAPLLLLTGLWALPAIPQGLSPDANTSFEYLTFDTLLTGILLLLAIRIWRGKRSRNDLWIITLILVVSSLTALAESLIPATYADFGLALLLILPVMYQLFFDSAELNVIGETQGARLIRTLGFQAGLMLVVALALVLELIVPSRPSFEAVANKIFLPPILALYLTAEISNHKNPLYDSEETL